MYKKTVLRIVLTFAALYAGMFFLGVIATSLWLTGGASWFDAALIENHNFASPVFLALICTYAMQFRCTRSEEREN